jgi:hypothetical protein
VDHSTIQLVQFRSSLVFRVTCTTDIAIYHRSRYRAFDLQPGVLNSVTSTTMHGLGRNRHPPATSKPNLDSYDNKVVSSSGILPAQLDVRGRVADSLRIDLLYLSRTTPCCPHSGLFHVGQFDSQRTYKPHLLRLQSIDQPCSRVEQQP